MRPENGIVKQALYNDLPLYIFKFRVGLMIHDLQGANRLAVPEFLRLS